MFDRAFYNNKTMNNYNQSVDHLVQSMNKSDNNSSTFYSKDDAPFDTQAYKNYKQLVDKEREQIDMSNITEYLYKLGFRIDQQLQRIIDKLNDILEEENESV